MSVAVGMPRAVLPPVCFRVSTWLLSFAALLLTSRCQAAPAPAPVKESPRLGARAELVHTLSSHALCVYHVVFSPDGKLLATSSKDKSVKLWDAASGKEVRTLRGHSGEVYSSAFRFDGKLLATAGEDHTVKLWDVAAGKEVRTCTGHTGDVYNVAFSPDGKMIASVGQDQTVRLWDTATGKTRRTLTGHTARVCTVAFSPDGRHVVSTSPSAPTPGSDRDHGEVKVWDASNGQEVLGLGWRDPGIVTIVFSPDGRRLAGSCLNQKVKLWELATGGETLNLSGHSLDVYNVAFSPDGRHLASSSGQWSSDKGGEVKIWDLAAGRELLSFRPHTTPIWSVAFSPDGRRLATASGKWRKTERGEVKVWQLVNLSPPRPAIPPKTELDVLWQNLAAADAARAYLAVIALSESPRRTVPFLLEHVRPVAPCATAEQIAQLIRDLDNDQFAVREKAGAALEQLGRTAHPALRKALQSPSLEVRRRAAGLLEKRGDGLPTLSAEEARGLRVVEVLLRIGTPDVRPVLQQLARGDAGSPVTQEAAAALEWLARRSRAMSGAP